jgi:hypothetical protein
MPTYVADLCPPSVAECIGGCDGNDACVEECIAADSNCFLCVNLNLWTCAYDNGCAATWNAVDCCIQARCPEGSSSACAGERCGVEVEAFNACQSRVFDTRPPCLDRLADCF